MVIEIIGIYLRKFMGIRAVNRLCDSAYSLSHSIVKSPEHSESKK